MNNLSLRERFEQNENIQQRINYLPNKRLIFSDRNDFYYCPCSSMQGDEDVKFVNGAWWMFKELESKINCNHNWVGKSENQYCSKCGIGDE